MNTELIASEGDSVQVQRYDMKVESDAGYFAIGDIDLYGKETLHGPFKLGEQHGIESDRKSIDWQAIDQEKALDLETQRQKDELEQMQQRNVLRQQR